MTENSLVKLLRSEAFLVLVLDIVIALALYFTSKYGSASFLEDTKFVIITLQPLFLAVIGAVAWKEHDAVSLEVTRIEAQADIERARAYAITEGKRASKG